MASSAGLRSAKPSLSLLQEKFSLSENDLFESLDVELIEYTDNLDYLQKYKRVLRDQYKLYTNVGRQLKTAYGNGSVHEKERLQRKCTTMSNQVQSKRDIINELLVEMGVPSGSSHWDTMSSWSGYSLQSAQSERNVPRVDDIALDISNRNTALNVTNYEDSRYNLSECVPDRYVGNDHSVGNLTSDVSNLHMEISSANVDQHISPHVQSSHLTSDVSNLHLQISSANVNQHVSPHIQSSHPSVRNSLCAGTITNADSYSTNIIPSSTSVNSQVNLGSLNSVAPREVSGTVTDIPTYQLNQYQQSSASSTNVNSRAYLSTDVRYSSATQHSSKITANLDHVTGQNIVPGDHSYDSSRINFGTSRPGLVANSYPSATASEFLPSFLTRQHGYNQNAPVSSFSNIQGTIGHPTITNFDNKGEYTSFQHGSRNNVGVLRMSDANYVNSQPNISTALLSKSYSSDPNREVLPSFLSRQYKDNNLPNFLQSNIDQVQNPNYAQLHGENSNQFQHPNFAQLNGENLNQFQRPNFPQLHGENSNQFQRPNVAQLNGENLNQFQRPNVAQLHGENLNQFQRPNFAQHQGETFYPGYQHTRGNLGSIEQGFPNFLSPANISNLPSRNEHYNPVDVMTSHLLELEIIKKGIQPFSGKAHTFWPWIGKMDDYLALLKNVTPMKVLQALESYSEGEPRDVIRNTLISVGRVSWSDAIEVYSSLETRFGSTQKASVELLDQVDNFKIIKGSDLGEQLQKLTDLCKVVLFNQPRCPELGQLNLASGLTRVRCKLPDFLQTKWAQVGQDYEDKNGNRHPPFWIFVEFLKFHAKRKSNKNYETITPGVSSQINKRGARVLHTTISPDTSQKKDEKEAKPKPNRYCPLHPDLKHSIYQCRQFKSLSFDDKKKEARRLNCCLKCLRSHETSNCDAQVKCYKCDGDHLLTMHDPSKDNGEDKTKKNALCTRVCGTKASKNCSKTMLVEVTMDSVPNKSLWAYAILDEQSNVTLVDDSLVDYFGGEFPSQEYSLSFASQKCEMSTSGRLVTGLKIRGKLEDEIVSLPPALSCPEMTNTCDDVASAEIVANCPSISSFTDCFPRHDPEAQVLLLVGRDCARAMATECLTFEEPYVHKSPLGYSVVGNVCPNKSCASVPGKILKTQVYRNVQDVPTLQDDYSFHDVQVKFQFSPKSSSLNFDTFEVHKDDESLGHSTNSMKFLKLMKDGISIIEEGNIQLPVPLKYDSLPDDSRAVYTRTSKMLSKMKNQPIKLSACLESMQKSIDAGFVEPVPADEIVTDNPFWYLPVFAVEQVKKSKWRIVFDGKYKYLGISINDALYQGPDLNNFLRGVLLRLREKPIGFGSDINAMFNNFKVPPKQKDLLRFYWFSDNDPDAKIVPFRSNCHIFGLTSSPAVAAFALKFCAGLIECEDPLTYSYIDRGFYVDDGLYSVDTPAEAVQILSKAISVFQRFRIRLHKIVSNSREVLQHFPESERAATITQLPCDQSANCTALGVEWNNSSDTFLMNPSMPPKPFTKRGILSAISSLYDPIGISAPVSLMGKLLQREILIGGKNNDLSSYDWDDTLPETYLPRWSSWLTSLSLLKDFSIPRAFYPIDFRPVKQELHMFSDASDLGIGIVCYMRSINELGVVSVAFVTGSSKVTPRAATTMPRLELCAALEAARCVVSLLSELQKKPDQIFMHCDSTIVLGYLRNDERRFTKYVERRKNVILEATSKHDWLYIRTDNNPADMASRPHTPEELLATCWLKGPLFLWDSAYCAAECSPELPDTPQPLPEEKIQASILHVRDVPIRDNFSQLFDRVSSFSRLIGITKCVLRFIRSFDGVRQKFNSDIQRRSADVSKKEAITVLVKAAQAERYSPSIEKLSRGEVLPENLRISELAPQLDSDGVLRVGGRLKHAEVDFSVKHPMLLPKNHALSKSVAAFYHEKSKHQGSHISHSTLIQAGFHIENGRQLIKNLISSCIICRRLRGKLCTQLMADLPLERVESVPSFTHIAIDAFGPFYIHDGKQTRRTPASKKIWALIFVCLPSRAIHLEPLHAMDVSSFRNAFSRFNSIRGVCKSIHSDQGSNFVCAKRQMKESVNLRDIAGDLTVEGVEWKMNPPQASHHGGHYERKIGAVRRVFEAALLLVNNRPLSRDEFYTFLAESASIVNNTPLWSATDNPNDPTPLSPSMILTMKDNPNPPSIDVFSEEDINSYGPRRYRRVLALSEHFWHRWATEYLHTLNVRHKWKKLQRCISVGDMVLVRIKNSPRNTWHTGRVSSVKFSKDGLVRSASMIIPPLAGSTKTRIIERAITDLVLLMPSESHKC